jgi:hypothetical protein
MQVDGVDPSGNSKPLQVDATGALKVTGGSGGGGAGGATEAKQDAGNASLATIATNTGAAATSALQTSGNASLTTIATNSGAAATSALQTTGNTSLATIATNSGAAATSALQTTGNTSLATILSSNSKQRFATVTITTVNTTGVSATYAVFPSVGCTSLDIVNTRPDAVDLEYRRGGAGNTIVIPAGSSRMVFVTANANEISVRRVDLLTPVVAVFAEAYAV